MNLLQAKHGILIGKAGSDKTFFMRKLVRESVEKCIYISIRDDDFGDLPHLVISEPDDLENLKKRFHEYLAQSFIVGVSFGFKIDSGRVGHSYAAAYYNELLLLILSLNKYFTVILDDANFVAQGDFTEGYRAILEQKNFSVISIFQTLLPETEYVLDFADQLYLFQLSAADFRSLEERGLLSMGDTSVVDQAVGEYRIISR